MEKKVLSIKEQQVEVVDGKVVISSEELAKAIQNEEVRFDREEENEGGFFCINFGSNS